MSEIQPQPEQQWLSAEDEAAKESAFNDLLAAVYCDGHAKQPGDIYSHVTINAAANRYFDAVHIRSRPLSVIPWEEQENEAATVLATVAAQVMFNAESELDDDGKMLLFLYSHIALLKTETTGDPFPELVDRQARVMLDAYSQDPSISKAKYKRLFNVYKTFYTTNYEVSEKRLLPSLSSKLSFWTHIAEGGLMRLLVPRRMHIEPPLPPIGDVLDSIAADEQATYWRWMDTMHPRVEDDPNKPGDGDGKV